MIPSRGMRAGDGHERLADVRRRARGHGIVALAFTAYADDTRHLVERAGFDGYLAKPIDPARLLAAVAAALRDRTRAE
jgi:CheY-like chemotaxis protein